MTSHMCFWRIQPKNFQRKTFCELNRIEMHLKKQSSQKTDAKCNSWDIFRNWHKKRSVSKIVRRWTDFALLLLKIRYSPSLIQITEQCIFFSELELTFLLPAFSHTVSSLASVDTAVFTSGQDKRAVICAWSEKNYCGIDRQSEVLKATCSESDRCGQKHFFSQRFTLELAFWKLYRITRSLGEGSKEVCVLNIHSSVSKWNQIWPEQQNKQDRNWFYNWAVRTW